MEVWSSDEQGLEEAIRWCVSKSVRYINDVLAQAGPLVPTEKEIEFGFLVVEKKKKKGKLLCLENAQMTVSSSMAGKQNISQYLKQKKTWRGPRSSDR